MCGHIADPAPVKADFSVGWMQQSGNGLERCALACAVGADQGDYFALLNLDRNAFECVNVPVIGVDIIDLKHRGHVYWPPIGWVWPLADPFGPARLPIAVAAAAAPALPR